MVLPHPYMYIAYTARSFNNNNHKLLYSLYNSPQDTCNGASAPLLGVERRNTQIHAETAQAAMSSRSIVANPYLRDLVPHPNVHRQVSMDAQVVDGAGANSSISRTRKLADYDRLSTLVAGIEERSRRSCLNRDDKDMRMSAWRRQTARATGQGRDRKRAGSPGSIVTYGARKQTSTRQNQRIR